MAGLDSGTLIGDA